MAHFFKKKNFCVSLFKAVVYFEAKNRAYSHSGNGNCSSLVITNERTKMFTNEQTVS